MKTKSIIAFLVISLILSISYVPIKGAAKEKLNKTSVTLVAGETVKLKVKNAWDGI